MSAIDTDTSSSVWSLFEASTGTADSVAARSDSTGIAFHLELHKKQALSGTFSELRNAAVCVASWLAPRIQDSCGDAPRDNHCCRVAVLLPRSPALLATVLALSLLRVPWVLLDVRHTPGYISKLHRIVSPCFFISSSDIPLPAAADRSKLVLLDKLSDTVTQPQLQPLRSRSLTLDSKQPVPLYFIFTSGSSHSDADDPVPRCVAGTSKGLLSRVRWIREHPAIGFGSFVRDVPRGIQSDERIVWRTPVSFVDTVAEMLTGALCGFSTVILPESPSCGEAAASLWAKLSSVWKSREIPTSEVPAIPAAESVHSAVATATADLRLPIVDPQFVMRLVDSLSRSRVTRLTLVPSMVRPLLAAAEAWARAISPGRDGRRVRHPLSTLRTLILSGEQPFWHHAVAVYRHMLHWEVGPGGRSAARLWTAELAATTSGCCIATAVGASLTKDISPQDQERLPRILNVYGCAEAGGDSTAYDASVEALCVASASLAATAFGIGASSSHIIGEDLCGPAEAADAMRRSAVAFVSTATFTDFCAHAAIPAGVPIYGNDIQLQPWEWGADEACGRIMSGMCASVGWTAVTRPGLVAIVGDGVAHTMQVGGNAAVTGFGSKSSVENSSGITEPARFCTSDVGFFAVNCSVLKSAAQRHPSFLELPSAMLAAFTCPCGCLRPLQLVLCGRASDLLEAAPQRLNAADATKISGMYVNPAVVEHAALSVEPWSFGNEIAAVTFARAIIHSTLHLVVGVTCSCSDYSTTTLVTTPPELSQSAYSDSLCRHLCAHLYTHLPPEAVPAFSNVHVFTHQSLLPITRMVHLPPPLPLGPTGKVDASFLIDFVSGASFASRSSLNRPGGPALISPEAVFECCKALLLSGGHMQSAGIDSSFWDLGGDSLTAVMYMHELQGLVERICSLDYHKAPVFVTFDDLVQCSTASALSALLSVRARKLLGGDSASQSFVLGLGSDALCPRAAASHGTIISKSRALYSDAERFAVHFDAAGASQHPIIETSKAGAMRAWYRHVSCHCCTKNHFQHWLHENMDVVLFSNDLLASQSGSQLHSLGPTLGVETYENAPLPALSDLWSVDMGQCIDASVLMLLIPPVSRSALCGRSFSERTVAIVGSHDCAVYCIDVSMPPRVLWRTELPDRVEGAATLHPHTRAALVPCYDGALYALDVASGEVLWAYSTSVDVDLAALDGSAPVAAAAAAFAAGRRHQPHVEVLRAPPRTLQGAPSPHDEVLRSEPRPADVPKRSRAQMVEPSVGEAQADPPRQPKRWRCAEVEGGSGERDKALPHLEAGTARHPLKASAAVDGFTTGLRCPACCADVASANGDVFIGGYDRCITQLRVQPSSSAVALPAIGGPISSTTSSSGGSTSSTTSSSSGGGGGAWTVRAVSRTPVGGSVVASPVLVALPTLPALASSSPAGAAGAGAATAVALLVAATSGDVCLLAVSSPSTSSSSLTSTAPASARIPRILPALWSLRMSGPVFGTPAVQQRPAAAGHGADVGSGPIDLCGAGTGTGTVVVPCVTGEWWGVELATGRVLWRSFTDARRSAVVAPPDNRSSFGTDGGGADSSRITAASSSSGSPWRYPAFGAPTLVRLRNWPARGIIRRSTDCRDHGVWCVVCAAHDGTVRCMEVASGALLLAAAACIGGVATGLPGEPVPVVASVAPAQVRVRLTATTAVAGETATRGLPSAGSAAHAPVRWEAAAGCLVACLQDGRTARLQLDLEPHAAAPPPPPPPPSLGGGAVVAAGDSHDPPTRCSSAAAAAAGPRLAVTFLLQRHAAAQIFASPVAVPAVDWGEDEGAGSGSRCPAAPPDSDLVLVGDHGNRLRAIAIARRR